MNSWYTVFCKPRGEGVAESNLRNQGYETYLPLLSSRARKGGAWQDRISPLFPRYLFMRSRDGRQGVATVRSTRGVNDLVRFGGQVARVPNELIEQLRAGADPVSGAHIRQDLLAPGGRVRFVDGPLNGLEGVVEIESEAERVSVLLDMLGKTNRIKVSRDWLVPASI